MIRVEPAHNTSTETPKLPFNKSPYIQVALRALAELAISLALAAVCSVFTVTPLILWQVVAIQFVANTAIRLLSRHSPANWATAFNFAACSLYNPQILLHEIGHFLADHALLNKSCPTIRLDPFVGGCTKTLVARPSALGYMIGAHRIQPLVALAGPGLSLTASALQLKLGLKLYAKSPNSPELARILISASLLNFLYHARYALSALWACQHDLCHDFVALRAVGLHPLLAAIAIIAIPILIIRAWQKTPSHPKSERPALLPCRI